MHDLIPLAADAGAIIAYTDEHDAIRAFAENEKAQSTRRAYRADFAAFSAWCRECGLYPLPADPQVVAWHISAIASGGLSVSSIGRRLAGSASAHKLAKEPNPATAEDVKVILAGIRRTVGTAPRRKAAATADRVRAMLDACPPTMLGIRDRALLALGFAGAFRRSELVALRVADLTEVPDGFRVTIRRSKTDQTGEGHEIVIPRGLKIRPVEAVRTWLQAAGISDGLLFRAVHRGGHVRAWGLRGEDVALVVKHYATAGAWTRRSSAATACARASQRVPPRPARASSRSWRRRGISRSMCSPRMSAASTCSRTTRGRRSCEGAVLPLQAALDTTVAPSPARPAR